MTKYRKSEEFLKRAEEVIPLGSQTFSKSRTQYPVGISPLFASRAKGPYLWDLDLL
jgi:glutamate-1-semialdehyde 2,1-aminomutase